MLLRYLLLNWLPTLLINNGSTRIQADSAQIGFNIGGALRAFLMDHLLEGGFRNPDVLITFIASPILLVTLANAPAGAILITAIVAY